MILIDCVYINNSGGKILLEYFIETAIKKNQVNKFLFLLDIRIELNDKIKNSLINYEYIINSESNRIKFYRNNIKHILSIFCFANVPPPISINNINVFILFHNNLLLNPWTSLRSEIKKSIIFYFKKLYIKFKNNNNYIWIVQTKSVKYNLSKNLNVNESKIKILPFFFNERPKEFNQQLPENKNNFLYVADGSGQKNHKNLLKSLEYLPIDLSKTINLHLTVPVSCKIILKKIITMQSLGYNIINHGYCTKDKINSLYKNCNFLIFPSKTESFGLPLLEAAFFKCKIIASDLPFVYDITDPLEVFNPNDPKSISLAIQRALNSNKIIKNHIKLQNQIDEIFNLLIC
jgi:glycosyltransferase involved in cell wall biosynthesis